MKLGKTFGDNMRAARKRAGMTQSSLAEVVGVAAPTLNRWETGSAQAPFDKAEAIARALGIEAWTLFAPESALAARRPPTPAEALEVLAVALRSDMLYQATSGSNIKGVAGLMNQYDSMTSVEKVQFLEALASRAAAPARKDSAPPPRHGW